MDIASLGVEVYTDSVRSGTKDLNALTDASIRAQDQTQALGAATERARQIQQGATSSIVAGSAALERNMGAATAMIRAELALANAAAARATSEARALAATGQASKADQDAANSRASLARQRVEAIRLEMMDQTALTRVSAAGSAQIREEVSEMTALTQRAAQLRSVLDPLGTAQARYNSEIAEYNMLAAKGVISARELGEAHALAAQKLHNYRAVISGMENTAAGRQANLANVVAQFQDIGVTAQMGMNPLTIALQQGTQLTQAFAMMENPIKSVGQALLSLVSPLSLITLGLVAAAAAAIQFVDWIAVGKAALNGLADLLEDNIPVITGVAAALALIFAPQIIGGIVALIAWLGRLAAAAVLTGARIAGAWIVAMGPVTWVLGGIAAIITALYMFRDQVTQIFGRDIVKDIENSANYIIGSFVGAFKGIQAIWQTLPAVLSDIVITAVNMTIRAVEGMINAVSGKIREWIDFLPKEIRPDFLKPGDVDFEELDNPNAGAAGAAFDKIGEEVSKAQQFNYVGAAATAMSGAINVASDAVRGLAASFGESDKEAEKAKKKYDKITLDAEQFIAGKEREIAALGMTKEAAAALRYEQELLNKAADQGLKLSEPQIAALKALAVEMASVEERLRVLTEWYNLGKSVLGSFFSDIKEGLVSGAGLWETFANAAANALDRIADKLISMAADGLFDLLFGSLMSGITGGITGGLTGGPRAVVGLIPGLGSFSTGGYTGDTPANRVAGMVHGQEYVLNAAATQRIGVGNLDAINAGAGLSAQNTSAGGINIFNEINVPPGTSADVAPAIAREVTKELRKQLPDAIQKYEKNPLRRAS